MKKILVSIVAMLMAAPSFAQFSSGGFDLSKENVYYGLRLGLNLASVSGDQVAGYKADLGTKSGMVLGGVIGLRVSDSTPLFLESGLYYSERGGKSDRITANYNCIDIPLLIKYGIQVSDNIALLPYVGPYVSRAFTGKTKQPHIDKDGNATSVMDKVGTFDEEQARTGGFKRLNMGFKIGCGAEYNKLYLEAGYQFGVSNIAKGGSNEVDMSAHSNALYVNFGINF